MDLLWYNLSTLFAQTIKKSVYELLVFKEKVCIRHRHKHTHTHTMDLVRTSKGEFEN